MKIKSLNYKNIVRSILVLTLSALICLAGCNSSEKNSEQTGQNTDHIQAGQFDEESSENSHQKKRVALTLDDGPHNVRTKAIVDELSKYGFHATFFVVGNRVDGTEYSGGKTLSYITEHGNEIGIHGYTHSTSAYYDVCSDETYEYEISETANAIHKYLPQYEITLMRPVGGRISQERLAESDYSIIMWSVDSLDWSHKSRENDAVAKANIDAIVETVMSSVSDGSIILMHDIYENTYEAVKIILERLDAEGYEVVTVSELIGDPEPAVKYSSGKRSS